jgi:hypothetical protein
MEQRIKVKIFRRGLTENIFEKVKISPKTKWGLQTDNKHESSQSVHETNSLLNGRNTNFGTIATNMLELGLGFGLNGILRIFT